MESNISRDHIAMEAMKILIQVSTTDDTPILKRIKRLFGKECKIVTVARTCEIANIAYKYADAMISEREKNGD